MSSTKMVSRVLNLHSGNPSLMKGILGPLSRGHHQIGVTVYALPRSNSQAGSLAPSGSFSIRRMVKLGLVTYPQKYLTFTCDVSRSRPFSSTTGDAQPGERPSSQSIQTNESFNWIHLKDLLKVSQKDQDVRSIEEALKKLDESGLKIKSTAVISMIMEFFYRQGNLEKTLHYKALHADSSTFTIRDITQVNLATIMASQGQFEEAEKLISEHCPHDAIKDSFTGLSYSVYNLLSAIRSSGDVGRVRRMLDLLLKKGYYSGNPPNAHLVTLVKILLEKNDIDSAVEELMQAIKKYKYTPSLNLVFQALIQKSEADKLQKVIDAASKVREKQYVLMNLASAFLQLDNLTKALEIIKTSVGKLPDRHLNTMLIHLVHGRKIETLEEFVKQSKDLDVNRDLMYYHLLRAYVLEKNVQKALEAWSSMQKEGAEPSDSTLHLLGNFLTQNGQLVPFSFFESAGPYPYNFKDKAGREDRARRPGPREPRQNFQSKENSQNKDDSQVDDSSTRDHSPSDRKTRR